MTIKTFTSASANKFLRTLEEEKQLILANEGETCTYVLAKDEEAEVPEYDYLATREAVAAIDEQVRKVRHALHKFNMDTTLPDSNMTVDEALIYMAQLNRERYRLDQMRTTQPRQRVNNRYGGNLIEYRYANFDIERAKADCAALVEEINALQLKIDLCNQTLTFEVEL